MIYQLENESIRLVRKRYNNNNLAVVCLIADGLNKDELFMILTTNLGEKVEPDCGYIDVNKGGQEIVRWIVDNGIGEVTGEVRESGFVTYPEVRFNVECLSDK